MKTITCYFDFISPFAYLAFEALPKQLMGVSHRMVYRPVFLGPLLRHHGQLGPAEIDSKREWTYRQVMWLAKQQGVQLDMPATHPFNPLPLLRLAVACSPDGEPNRYVCETIFKHVWHGGADAVDATRLHALVEQLAPPRAMDAEDVKATIKTNTDTAMTMGVFGVPMFEVDGKFFWGLDSLPMMRAYLDGDQWFDTAWDAAASIQQGIKR
jgi:2-hydroxychromene-2-carboxylate isomerase